MHLSILFIKCLAYSFYFFCFVYCYFKTIRPHGCVIFSPVCVRRLDPKGVFTGQGAFIGQLIRVFFLSSNSSKSSNIFFLNFAIECVLENVKNFL